MPLENFYQNSDKTAQRRQNRIALSFIATAAYLIFGWWLVSDSMEQDPRRKAENEQIKSVYALCDGIAKPESLLFVRRDLPFRHASGTSVNYYYKSPDTHDELMFAFSHALDSKLWKRLDYKNGFTNGDRTILIDRAYGDADYYIFCYQEDISFGIDD